MANTTVPIDPSGLIGIFKIDKDDLKDLKLAIGDSRKQSLADALAVFAGRAKSVVDFAENKIAQFEQGYFAAKLGGTSGRDMRALEAVAQDFGVSVEAMRNSTQALHRNVRDDPKIAALLEQLHISSSDGAGAQRNSADLMLELSDALKRMDPAQARATGQSLGLDPGVMEALRDPGFGQRLSVRRDAQENSTVEAAGERAHQLMGTIRELSGSVNAMFAQALLTMGPKLQETLDGISAWFKENGQTAGKRLGEVGNFVLSIMSLLGPVISLITWLDGLTGGLSSQLLVLVGGFLMLGGGGVVGALMGLVSRLGGMRSIIGGLGAQLASLPGRISGVVSRAWTATSNFVGGVFGRMTSMGRTAVTQMGNMASAVWSWMGNMAARGGALVVDSVKAAGATALQWGQSLWASASSWIGRIVDGAKSLARGVAISPVAAGVGLGLYPSTLGDGTLKSLQGDRGVGLGQQEPRVDGAAGIWQPPPMDGARIEPWRDYHSGFALGEAGGAALAPPAAAAPVSVNATTTIYVNGSADPGATGAAVANQQSRVNADLTRNLQGSYD
ncbi:phage tail protein [Achromobacter dolens]|uniref:phage tail protein n=1 Tax=Achromobacter dolens TaxID=1287738 RepID=UPI0011A93912|nr:phage tail protein [Achromobacter dolens]